MLINRSETNLRLREAVLGEPSPSDGPQDIFSQIYGEQREDWRNGRGRLAEDYLLQYPVLAADEQAKLELIHREFMLRQQLGERPSEKQFFERVVKFAPTLAQQFILNQRHWRITADFLTKSGDFGDSLSQSRCDTEIYLDPAQLLPELGARFSLRKILGAGATGVVYLADDHCWSEPVAIKVLRRLTLSDIERFKDEFRVCAHISHPNLVSLHELNGDRDLWWLVMEYVDGEDFLVRLGGPEGSADRTAATPERLRSCFYQLAAGLAALHAAGRVHGDVKPSNVLVTQADRVVLLDFSLTTDFALLQREGWDGKIKGTPAYMAPEQFVGAPPSAGADLYAIGLLLFEALTGGAELPEDPRQAPSGVSLRSALDRAHASSNLAALCVDLLSRDPQQRPDAVAVQRRLAPATIEFRVNAPPRVDWKPIFVGRGAELDSLRSAWETARSGKAIVQFVSGPAGMGKTALLERFLQQFEGHDNNPLVLYGRCYERETHTFKALDAIVRQLAKDLSLLSQGELARRVPDDLANLLLVFPVFGRLNNVAPDLAKLKPNPDPRIRRKQTFAAFWQLVQRCSADRGVVLALDDMQWSDLDSVSFLEWMLRRSQLSKVLIVACHRDDDLAPALQGLKKLTLCSQTSAEIRQLRLAWLRPEAAQQILDHEGLTNLSEAVADELIRAAQGNPYSLRELAEHVRRRGRLDAGGDISIDQVSAERARQLPEPCRELLEILSVAGQPLERGEIVEALGAGFPSRSELLWLINEHLIRGIPSERGEMYVTFHDRLREEVVARLPPERRRRLHERLAQALERGGQESAARLAAHYEAAGDLAGAARFAIIAADQASRKLAFDQASILYEKALAWQSLSPPEERRLRIALGESLAGAGRDLASARAFMELIEQADSADGPFLCRRAGEQLMRSGDLAEGLNLLRNGLRSQGVRTYQSRWVLIASVIARKCYLSVRGFGIDSVGSRAALPQLLSLIDTYQLAGGILATHDGLLAADYMLRGAMLAAKSGDPRRIGFALTLDACFAAVNGERRHARRSAWSARQLLRRSPAIYFKAMPRAAFFFTRFYEGRWRAAARHAEACVAYLRQQPHTVALAQMDFFWNWALWYSGDLAGLANRVRQNAKTLEEPEDSYALLMNLSGLAVMARLADDDLSEARKQLRQTQRNVTERPNEYFRAVNTLAECYIALYAGEAASVSEPFLAQWRSLKRTGVTGTPMMQFEFHQARARLGLQLVRAPKSALRDVLASVRRLEKLKIHGAQPMAAAFRASLANRLGDESGARRNLEAALQGFHQARMPLFAALAAYCLGLLARNGGDDVKSQAGDRAEAPLLELGVKNPARLANGLLPGFVAK